MIFLDILLALVWILGFTILGCLKAKKGTVWGLFLATIGLGIFGLVLGYYFYETWKKNEETKKTVKLFSRLTIV